MDRPTSGSNARSNSELSLPDNTSQLTLHNRTPQHSLSQTASSDMSRTPSPPPSRTPSRTPTPKPKDPKKSTWTQTLAKTVTAVYNNRHDLGGAAPRYLWSHLEYGHILLDPAELKAQYDQLRLTKVLLSSLTYPRSILRIFIPVFHGPRRRIRINGDGCFVRYQAVWRGICEDGMPLRCRGGWMNLLPILRFLCQGVSPGILLWWGRLQTRLQVGGRRGLRLGQEKDWMHRYVRLGKIQSNESGTLIPNL
jgi:hypothetical protein